LWLAHFEFILAYLVVMPCLRVHLVAHLGALFGFTPLKIVNIQLLKCNGF